MTIEWPTADLLAFQKGEAYFQASLICRRGHVLDSSLNPHELKNLNEQKCSTCGATCLKTCPKCNFRIKGRPYVPQVISFRDFEPHSFCDNCGAAFPWASQQDRIWELQNILDEEELSESDRTAIAFQLEKISSGILDADDESKAWKKIKNSLGTVFDKDKVQNLIFDLVGSVIKNELLK
jgi:hypothetical protein